MKTKMSKKLVSLQTFLSRHCIDICACICICTNTFYSYKTYIPVRVGYISYYPESETKPRMRVITKITHECTGLYPGDHTSSSSWFLSKSRQLLYIRSELHCKTIAYKVTTTIPIDYYILAYTKSYPHCKLYKFYICIM